MPEISMKEESQELKLCCRPLVYVRGCVLSQSRTALWAFFCRFLPFFVWKLQVFKQKMVKKRQKNAHRAVRLCQMGNGLTVHELGYDVCLSQSSQDTCVSYGAIEKRLTGYACVQRSSAKKLALYHSEHLALVLNALRLTNNHLPCSYIEKLWDSSRPHLGCSWHIWASCCSQAHRRPRIDSSYQTCGSVCVSLRAISPTVDVS